MANKPARSIADQIALLQSRNMLFRNIADAPNHLLNISYYRLKGYWWDMQNDYVLHILKPNTYFEDIIERYNFDRHLRLILFDAIERVEISLRTKMIYHLSLSYGSLWYLNPNLFDNGSISYNSVLKTQHAHTLDEIKKEFNRSKEIFIEDHKNRFPNQDADAWKILEVASLGNLSKLYKSLNHQLPEKATIAKEMGLNLHTELSSWLEAITYLRNIIAHHARLWSRNMVKKPIDNINNPIQDWLSFPLSPVQKKKPFLIISTLIYLCNNTTPNNQIKANILNLINQYPNIPIYKMGFLNNWDQHDIWK